MPYSQHLQHATQTLFSGGVIAYPTEAVWGLGCDPHNRHAVEKLLAMKQRPAHKGLILVAANIDQFQPYLQGLSEHLLAQLNQAWPGPRTFIVPDNGFAPSLVRGDHHGVALRVSQHPSIISLCHHFGGPIVSTSANRSRLPAAKWPWQIRKQWPKQLDYLLPGTLGSANKPSQIIDLVSGTILRPA